MGNKLSIFDAIKISLDSKLNQDQSVKKSSFFQNAPEHCRLRGLEHQLLRSPRQVGPPHGHRQREPGNGRPPFRQQGNSNKVNFLIRLPVPITTQICDISQLYY